MNEPTVHFGRIALRGGLVTGAAQAIRIGVQFLSVVIMARLLTPEDFGLVASVAPIIAFVGLFQNLGLQQAVIQRRDITQRQLNQVFWLTVLVGIGSTFIAMMLSPAVAAFYGDRRLLLVTIAAGAPLFLGSISSLPLSLMNRNLQFAQLALNDILISVVTFATSAIAAYAGLGYWSLLLASAVSALVSMVAAWNVARWKPNRPEWHVDRDILSFGANLTGFNLVNFFSRNLDNILIGRFAGPVQLGYYDRGYKLLLFPLQNINQPLTRVMVPLLSRIQEDKARFRDIYMRTNWVLGAVAIPGIAALVCASHDVIALLFGPRWLPVAPIFFWLGIAGIIQPLCNTTGWLFICQGKTRTMFRWGIYSTATTVVSFFAGLPWGAAGVAAAYAISNYVMILPVLAVVVRATGPVTGRDFLTMQGLFVTSALLTWFAYQALPAEWIAGSSITAIAAAVVISYAIAGLLMMILTPSRSALTRTLGNILSSLGAKARLA